jgi:hypothetical protein
MGFVKGHIKTDEWKWIGNKLNKRKLNENKESEFHSGGEQVQLPRLKKAKYRDAYVSTIAKFSTGKLRIVMLPIVPRINRLAVFQLLPRRPQMGSVFAPQHLQG